MVRLPPTLRPLFPYLKPIYTRTASAAAPTMQWLSARRRGWLPTGVAATLEDAARAPAGRCVVARPAEVITRGQQLGRPAGLPLADDSDGENVGRVAVAELPGGRVLGPHRAVITGNGLLVDEVSRYFGTRRARQHPLFLHPSVPAPVEVDGRLAVLAARGDSNYYHFLFDVLPRLGVLEQAHKIAPPDRYYVPAATRFQREALEQVGITGSILVDAAQYPHVRAETLIVPGPPAVVEKNPPWVIAFLRQKLLTQPASHLDRRLYVTRGRSTHNRSVVNEDAVLTLLTARGFEAIDPGAMSLPEQIGAFASASLIVAPHGAALANLAFASPGAAVIELFPAGCLLPDFWRLACGVPGLRYRYLSAPNPGRRTPSRGATIVRDIAVDVPALGRLLDELS